MRQSSGPRERAFHKETARPGGMSEGKILEGLHDHGCQWELTWEFSKKTGDWSGGRVTDGGQDRVEDGSSSVGWMVPFNGTGRQRRNLPGEKQ